MSGRERIGHPDASNARNQATAQTMGMGELVRVAQEDWNERR